jgi:ADP-ribose pyrophosphatase YjhB (NUDIX family)
MLYDLLKILVSMCFNLLNKLLGGGLPPFGSAAVIVEQDNRYLVVELPRGRLAFPGGFMKWRETPAQTAKREGKEETGLDLHVDHLINIYARTSKSLFNMSTICFIYRAEVLGGKLCKNIEGVPLWLTEDELRNRFDAYTLGILEDYLRFRKVHRDVITSKWTGAPSTVSAGFISS